MYEADAQTLALRKHGRKLRLSGQPFQILLMLLRANGDLVTREDVRQALWPDGTFVDFDHSLNSAVNKLRDTLSDSATSPRYIETLAKRGYRFIAPITTDVVEKPATHIVSVPAAPETTNILTGACEVPQVAQTSRARTTFLLAQLMYFCFYIAGLANLREIDELLNEVTPFAAVIFNTLIVTACIGIAVRLFLGAAFLLRAPEIEAKYLRLFPFVAVLDVLWAFSPLLMVKHIGLGLALAAAAALTLVPFGQRTLILMLTHTRSSR